MKLFLRLIGIWLLLGCAQAAWAQPAGPKVDRVDIRYVGPTNPSASSSSAPTSGSRPATFTAQVLPTTTFTRFTPPDSFTTSAIQLIRQDDGGVVVTYIVQANLRITDIKITGNKELSDSKIRKKITVKAGEPLDRVEIVHRRAGDKKTLREIRLSRHAGEICFGHV